MGQRITTLLPEVSWSPSDVTVGSCSAARETYACRKDGTKLHIEIRLSRIKAARRKAILAVVSDITRRKQVEEALLDSKEQIRLAQLSTNFALWNLDVEDNRLTWSPKALFGIEPDGTKVCAWIPSQHGGS